MQENWKPVVGYEAIYEVSDLGRVRSVDRIASDGSHRSGRILRPGRHRGGYAIVTLCDAGVERTRTVHRLVAEVWIGPQPAGREVCHKDGNAWRNEAKNLRWGTHRSNMLDQRTHGTNARSARTHCPEGHALIDPNLRASELRQGRRSCRACQLGRRRAAKRGVVFTHGDADDIYGRLMSGIDRRDAESSRAS